MKIIALMENELEDGLCAEHGLSLYIETKKHRILADTGQSDLTWQNAETLGLDLTRIDTLFLSHGHYDHAGGILSFAQKNAEAVILLHEKADGLYYSEKPEGKKYIGIDPLICSLPQVQRVSGFTVIDEELSIFDDVSLNRPFPRSNHRLYEKKDNAFVQDFFLHEQYLVIHEGDQYVLVSGCAHRGILNILDAFRRHYGKDPDIVISGFHMKQNAYAESDLEEIRRTAQQLKKMHTIFYTGHCTGSTAYGLMKKILGPSLRHIRTLKKI